VHPLFADARRLDEIGEPFADSFVGEERPVFGDDIGEVILSRVR
jgi:hypothetical protein